MESTPGEFPGEHPGELPGEFPGELPEELPGEHPGEFPTELPNVFSRESLFGVSRWGHWYLYRFGWVITPLMINTLSWIFVSEP